MNLAPSSDESSASDTRDVPEIRNRFQDLLDTESELTGVYTCDATGLITYFNKHATTLWGRTPQLGDTYEKFCGSQMMYRVDGSYLPHDQCPMADVLLGRVPGVFDGEVHVQRPDGSRVVVIVNIAPLIDDQGNIVGAVNSFRENTLRMKPR